MGGLLDAADRPAFPNATVYVPKADNDFYLPTATPDDVSAGKARSSRLVSRISAPYRAAGKWKTFQPGESPVQG